MPKIVTIIGLIFEGLGVVGAFVGGWIMLVFDQLPGYELMLEDLSPAEQQEVLELFTLFGNVLFAIGVFTGIFVIVNIYLFTKLIRGRFDIPTAKKVYMYQAIWGGINIIFNQITGILYLISGVTGYSGHKEEKDIREGI